MSVSWRGSFARCLVGAFISAFVANHSALALGQETREENISAIEKLGGEVFREEGVPGIRVSLRGPDITDAALTHLSSLNDLVWLDLSGSRITDAGLARLKQSKKLRRLDLSNTAITGAGLKHLKPLSELHSLELDRCPIPNAGLVELKGLVKLSYLGISHTLVDDDGLRNVALLRNLAALDLCNRRITDAGLAHLETVGQTQVDQIYTCQYYRYRAATPQGTDRATDNHRARHPDHGRRGTRASAGPTKGEGIPLDPSGRTSGKSVLVWKPSSRRAGGRNCASSTLDAR